MKKKRRRTHAHNNSDEGDKSKNYYWLPHLYPIGRHAKKGKIYGENLRYKRKQPAEALHSSSTESFIFLPQTADCNCHFHSNLSKFVLQDPQPSSLQNSSNCRLVVHHFTSISLYNLAAKSLSFQHQNSRPNCSTSSLHFIY